VRINETREFDDSVVEKMKKRDLNPYTYDQALPPAKVDERKSLIFEKLKQAFGQQLKNADVNFIETDEQQGDAPLIDITCRMKSKDNYYTFYYIGNAAGRGAQVSYYPGTNFVFSFSLKPGGAAESYETSFENSPPTLNTGGFKAENSDNYSFDEVLFGLVSDNFRNYIQGKFGFIDITNT
jgi:hypothetical protein